MQTGLEGKPWYFGLGVGVAVAAVLVLVGYNAMPNIKEMKRRIAGQEAHLEELQRKIQEGEAAAQRLPEFQARVARLEQDLEKLLRILPNKRNVHDLIRQFRAIAEREDFDLVKFAPRRETEREFSNENASTTLNEWPIQLNVQGSYHALARFFDRMSRFSRIINVDDLRVQAARSQGDATKILDASFTAKTFVFKEPEVEEDLAGGGGAP